ncbi:MAG TPA: alpha-amylase family protein [bacterium]|jgi:maltose alpha-D-glucosyltransferase/alpha-amylase
MNARPDLWYKNALIYAVDVKSFQDSDGDGIGDLRGMISRLDYLSRLGVTCLWLLPFYPSPLRDNGYDICDYLTVDARLGTLQDFIELVHRAGELGMRVITDLAFNHTSDEHPWFQAARRARDSRYRHYYVWSNTPPPVLPGGENAFPGTERSAWTYDEVAGAYYYHLFYHFQPDLNTANPDVVEEMRRLIHLWTSFGVAGFRLDAIGPMIDKRTRYLQNSEDPFSILHIMRQAIEERIPDGMLLGEANVSPAQLVNYFGKSGRLNTLLNFLISQYLFLALGTEDSAPLTAALSLIPPAPDDAQWVNFLRNLDELNLDKLTPEERCLVLQIFAPEPSMQLYQRGIRRRVATMLDGDLRRLRMAYSLLFSLRGSPMITYGDEIGMGDDLSLFERESVRSPMQWTAGPGGGFTTAKPECLIRPVIEHGPFGCRKVNVEDQTHDPESLLCWMQRLMLTRRQHPEIGENQAILETGNRAVFASRSDNRECGLLMAHNLSSEPQQAELPLGPLDRSTFSTVLGEAAADGRGDALRVTLEPYGFVWLSAQRLQADRSLPAAGETKASGMPSNGFPSDIHPKGQRPTVKRPVP